MDRYESYRNLFKSVDVKDPESLRRWFLEHDHLSTHDHAQIMNKCSKIVREYRIKAGLKGQRPSVIKPPCRKTIGPVDIPTHWKDKQWLTENLKKYSVNALLRSLKVCRAVFYGALHELEIPVGTGNVSKNPCCTLAWVHKHYVELKYSMDKCAKLAGITRPRFADWLTKFKIPARSTFEAFNKFTLPLAIKQVVKTLKKQDCVHSVKAANDHILVHWKYHTKKSMYIYHRLSPHQWRCKNIPKLYSQYESDLVTGEGYPAHFLIKKADCKDITVFERDVALYNLVMVLRHRRQWYWPTYPKSVLDKELKALKDTNLKKYLQGGMFISTKKSHGYKILINYFCMRQFFKNVISHRTRLILGLRNLFAIKRDVTLLNLLMSLRTKVDGYKHRLPSPSVYAAIFNRLNIKGSVLDMHTGTGSRAMACALQNLRYYGRPSESFNIAIDKGFASFSGINHTVWNGKDVVDCILCDADFSIGDIGLALTFADRAKMILAYVPHKLKDLMIRKYSPNKIVSIVNGLSTAPNYFFIW